MKDIPLEVSLACYIIWANLLVSLAQILLDAPLNRYFFATSLITLILSYWFVTKLNAGKNWMRILVLIGNTFTILFCIMNFEKVFNGFLYFLFLIFAITQTLLLVSKNSQKFFK